MIRCPHCGHEESKVDSQPKSSNGEIRRYRICKKCHRTFTTLEYLAINAGNTRGLVPDIPVRGGDG